MSVPADDQPLGVEDRPGEDDHPRSAIEPTSPGHSPAALAVERVILLDELGLSELLDDQRTARGGQPRR